LWLRVENCPSFALWKLRCFPHFAQNRTEIVVLWWKLKGSGAMKEGLNHGESGSSSAEYHSCGQGGAGSFYFSDVLPVSRIQPRKKRSTLREEGLAAGAVLLMIPKITVPEKTEEPFLKWNCL
jgi:hypothetical protein